MTFGLAGRKQTVMASEWMWPKAGSDIERSTVAQLAYFRTIVSLDEAPEQLVLTITADSRYRLTVNGRLVAFGPAKPSTQSWFVDTVDIASALTRGQNTVCVEVLGYEHGPTGNLSVLRTGSPGLRVSGTPNAAIDLSRPSSWGFGSVKA